MSSSYDYIFKYIIIGDAGVGKSSILSQFIDKKFRRTYDVTVGVDSMTRTLVIDEKVIMLRIWDTAGQECFRSVTQAYYRDAAGALLVYDVTRRETFNHAETWLEEARRGAYPNLSVILVGNKSDLCRKREVTTEEGQQFANDHGLSFMEASALTCYNVDEAFIETTLSIYRKIEGGVFDLSEEELRGIMVGYRSQGLQGTLVSYGGGNRGQSGGPGGQSRGPGCCW